MFKNIYFYLALIWTGIILFFCLENASNIPQVQIPNIDKVVHAIFHFVFTSLWFLYFKKKWSSTKFYKLLIMSFVCSFLFGIAIELMQLYFSTSRSADVLDVLANMTGALLAIIFISILNKYTRIVDKI